MFCRALPQFSLSSSHSRRVFASSAADRAGRSALLSVSRPPYRSIRPFDREDARRDRTPSSSSTSTPTAGVTHPRTKRNSTTTTGNGSGDGWRDVSPKKRITPRCTARPRRMSRREFCDARRPGTSSSRKNAKYFSRQRSKVKYYALSSREFSECREKSVAVFRSHLSSPSTRRRDFRASKQKPLFGSVPSVQTVCMIRTKGSSVNAATDATTAAPRRPSSFLDVVRGVFIGVELRWPPRNRARERFVGVSRRRTEKDAQPRSHARARARVLSADRAERSAPPAGHRTKQFHWE